MATRLNPETLPVAVIGFAVLGAIYMWHAVLTGDDEAQATSHVLGFLGGLLPLGLAVVLAADPRFVEQWPWVLGNLVILGLAAITIGVLRLRLLVLLSAAATALACVAWSAHLGHGHVAGRAGDGGPAADRHLQRARPAVAGSAGERRQPSDALAPRHGRADRRRRAGPLLARAAGPDHPARGPRDRHRRAAVPGRRRAQLGRRRARWSCRPPPAPRACSPRSGSSAPRSPASTSACWHSRTCWPSPTRSSRSSAIGSASTTTRPGCCAPIWPCSSRPSSPMSACTAPWRGPSSPRRRRCSRCSASTSRWCCSSRSAAPGRRSCRWRRSPPVSSPVRGTRSTSRSTPARSRSSPRSRSTCCSWRCRSS